MKKNILILLALTGLLLAFKPKSDVYTVDVTKSKIEWIGRKVTGQHAGEIKIASGTLSADGKNLTRGSFNINMTSMTCTDLDATSGGKLLGHLKSEDFFSTEKNPVSKFVITKVTPTGDEKATIDGKLTIKGITRPISFVASVKQQDDFIVAVAKGIKVDRTKYNIKYGSKNFFASIGDKAIDDEFELTINLVAKK